MSLLTVPLKGVGPYRHNLDGLKEEDEALVRRVDTTDGVSYEVIVRGKVIGLLGRRRELFDALERGWQIFAARISDFSGDDCGRAAPSINVTVFYSWGAPSAYDLATLQAFSANPPLASARRYSVNVVGESHRQPAIARTRIGETATLKPDPANRYDPRAVAVLNGAGEQIGFLPRDGWLTRALLDEGKSYVARIGQIHQPEIGRPHAAVVLDVVLE